MAELRWLILLFGALFVVGVYLAMRRQDGRRRSGGRRSERQEPMLGAGVDDADHDPWEDVRREPDFRELDLPGSAEGLPSELTDNDREAPAYLRRRADSAEAPTSATDELPIVTVGEGIAEIAESSAPRRPAEQLELSVPDLDMDEEDTSTEAPQVELEEVFTLRLVPRGGDAFQGDAVGQGLLTAGLARGRFDIFHYVPPGTDQSVFSVANLVEPGTLRDEDLGGKTLPGLTLFMLLPGPLPGTRALEEMITCSRLLANYLDAIVQDDTGGSLTRQTEEHLKERVVDFEHRRARAEH